MFDNPGKMVKKLGEYIFTLCIVVAILIFIVGVIRTISVLNEYSSLTLMDVFTTSAGDLYDAGSRTIAAYKAKTTCISAIYIAIASLSGLPIAAFGELVDDVSEIKNKINKD